MYNKFIANGNTINERTIITPVKMFAFMIIVNMHANITIITVQNTNKDMYSKVRNAFNVTYARKT